MFNSLERTLKSSLFLRCICAPCMNVHQKRKHFKYLTSNEPQRLKALKNQYLERRCFIIGNGASLKSEDLDLLESEITIASNRIYNIFPYTSWKPTIYMAEDPDGLSEMIPNILEQKISKIFVPFSIKGKITNKKNVFYGFWSNGKFIINRYNDKTSHISEDISDHFSIGYTVTFSAIQLAIYLGIKEIYLVGVDFNYSYVSDKFGRIKRVNDVTTYFDGKERNGSYLNYYSTLYAYEQAKKYCDTHNIKIYNATRGGKLEVFERVDFDTLFPNNEEEK